MLTTTSTNSNTLYSVLTGKLVMISHPHFIGMYMYAIANITLYLNFHL